MEKGLYISTIIILSLIFLGVLVSILTGVLLVPLVSTPSSIRSEILRIMEIKEKEMILDLGSGNGMFLIEASEKHGAQGIGYEISPIGIILARISKTIRLGWKNNIAIISNSFLNTQPFPSSTSKIYCYLNPKAMQTIIKKFVNENLKENIKIYSYKYPFTKIKEEEKKELSDGNFLYIYSGKSFN